MGMRSLGVTTDVSEETAVSALIDRIVDEFGSLDILVNTVCVDRSTRAIRGDAARDLAEDAPV